MIAFAIPGDLDLPTGGYAYDRRLLAEWAKMGVASRVLALPGGFPNPAAGDIDAAFETLRATDRNETILIDGLAGGVLPADRLQALDRNIVALVHHPLALETGLTPEGATALHASERAMLEICDRIVTTSDLTARLLVAGFGIARDRIVVAEPGVDRVARSIGSGNTTLSLLAVGSVVPRKGYDVLVRALAALSDLDWHLTIVGALDRAPQTVEALRSLLAAEGLSNRITLAGALEDRELATHFARADLFVSASLFEGYGMVLAEAMAHGLPIVASTGGAATETLPDAAAMKVAPDDVMMLAGALGVMMSDRATRQTYADTASAAARELPRWDDTAQIVAQACAFSRLSGTERIA